MKNLTLFDNVMKRAKPEIDIENLLKGVVISEIKEVMGLLDKKAPESV